MTSVIDVNKSSASILVLHEKDWNEFYCLTFPAGISDRKRKAAEEKLTSSGFRTEYRFDRQIIDRRSLSLAKAQAASVVKRIFDKTGIKMEIGHGIEVTGLGS